MSDNLVIFGKTINNVAGIKAATTGESTVTYINPSETTAAAGDVVSGKYFYTSAGVKTQGNIATKTASNLSASGKTVTVPAGYYASQVTKDVATGSATTPATTITTNPTISVDSSGLITATNSKTQSITPTVSAGYVSSGTAGTITVSGSNTSQLTTQAAQTITPTTIDQTIASGKYLTGTQTIKGDSNLVASNIADGVTIFGISGTHSGGGGGYEDSIIDRTISGSYENSTVTSIGVHAFYNCTSLSTVSFPACTTIGSQVFYNCIRLSTVSFPACTTIENYAFYNCTSLSTVSFPVCTTIGGSVFYYCKSLSTVSFPACTTIGSQAFKNCYNLISLYLPGSSYVSLAASNAFSSTPIDGYSASAGQYGSIYVPASMLESYKTRTNWTYFSSRFVSV